MDGTPGLAPARAWRRSPRVGTLTAALAGTALLVAACGGSPSATSGRSSGVTVRELDVYAACMRGHGVANFYFSKLSSQSTTPVEGIDIGGYVASGIGPQTPNYKVASAACAHLMPGGPPTPITQAQKEQMLRQAACIRSHGFPTYPDPQFPAGGGVRQSPPAGIDENSPQFQKAMSACSK
jgi:hypothetical protein